jgi:hypothetical protein
MKGPCGSDGGRRRYDAASPEPMYRVKVDGLAARQLRPALPTINQMDREGKGGADESVPIAGLALTPHLRRPARRHAVCPSR